MACAAAGRGRQKDDKLIVVEVQLFSKIGISFQLVDQAEVDAGPDDRAAFDRSSTCERPVSRTCSHSGPGLIDVELTAQLDRPRIHRAGIGVGEERVQCWPRDIRTDRQ